MARYATTCRYEWAGNPVVIPYDIARWGSVGLHVGKIIGAVVDSVQDSADDRPLKPPLEPSGDRFAPYSTHGSFPVRGAVTDGGPTAAAARARCEHRSVVDQMQAQIDDLAITNLGGAGVAAGGSSGEVELLGTQGPPPTVTGRSHHLRPSRKWL